ncbi:MAG TPA: AMP-binding protein [Anaerolineaceae bacterium]|nr:AMP-binding protein [Anaerolineaceae bacterium]
MNTALSFNTLTEPVIARAETDPGATTLIFIPEQGPNETITAAEFHARAGAYAQALRAIGVQSEDLVILVLRHSQELLFGFWGALYLGAIASIFPFLTEKLDPQIYKERVRELVAHSQAKAVITFPEFKPELSQLLASAGCQVLSTADIPQHPGQPAHDRPAAFDPDKIAFLQHSSGTTGLQKGVALSHRSVLNQVRSYSQAIRLTSVDKIVSWLPLYHDMGLIAGFVMPIVAGVPLVLMSPFHWVRSPRLLFQAIHEHRATLCWLPNFAYNHSVRGISQRAQAGLDLSSLRAWINCSEPVRYDSHQIFLERFTPNGVLPQSLQTCYAMAENTFAVTQSPLGEIPHVDWVEIRSLQEERRAVPMASGAPGATPMVSCGFPIQGTEVGVVDEAWNRLPERTVGEIIVHSDCMLSGYYRRPDLSQQSIRDGWYLTGDMGYMADRELYITGRKKDLIIVGGKNVYPQDLEAIANTIPGVYPGRTVAFGINDPSLGSESIVLVCELEGDQSHPDERRLIEQELRQRVIQQTEVTLGDVRLVDRRWLIKTSSGKIARSANRDKYLAEFNLGSA